MREHLQTAYERSGIIPEALALASAVPEGCEQLWSDFMALHLSRGSTGFGPARIAFADIDAFERVNRVKLDPWELDAIRRADNAYLVHYAETHKPEKSN